jgi:hypothetical protein
MSVPDRPDHGTAHGGTALQIQFFIQSALACGNACIPASGSSAARACINTMINNNDQYR